MLLVIDDDSLDNGSRFNASGGPIIPGGPNFFTPQDVNDDLSADGQRAVLRYFAANVGRTITVMTGETGDEGWFPPAYIPQKWLSGSGKACIDPASRDFKTAIERFSAGAVRQDALDKTPQVMSYRLWVSTPWSAEMSAPSSTTAMSASTTTMMSPGWA